MVLLKEMNVFVQVFLSILILFIFCIQSISFSMEISQKSLALFLPNYVDEQIESFQQINHNYTPDDWQDLVTEDWMRSFFDPEAMFKNADLLGNIDLWDVDSKFPQIVDEYFLLESVFMGQFTWDPWRRMQYGRFYDKIEFLEREEMASPLITNKFKDLYVLLKKIQLNKPIDSNNWSCYLDSLWEDKEGFAKLCKNSLRVLNLAPELGFTHLFYVAKYAYVIDFRTPPYYFFMGYAPRGFPINLLLSRNERCRCNGSSDVAGSE